MHLHEQAIMRIGWYLSSTCKKGMTYKPDSSKGLEVYVNADFAGGWVQLTLVMLTTSI
jgi:hypothetical protein